MHCLTWHAGEPGFQVRHEVSLARMYVHQVAETDLARRSSGTLAVEVDDDVLGTADVEVVVDAATKPHPAVHG